MATLRWSTVACTIIAICNADGASAERRPYVPGHGLQSSVAIDTVRVGTTQYDLQGTYTQASLIAIDSSGIVHLVWMDERLGARSISYNVVAGGVGLLGEVGCTIFEGGRPGFAAVAASQASIFTAYHLADDQSLYLGEQSDLCDWNSTPLTSATGSLIWPQIVTQQIADSLILHVTATEFPTGFGRRRLGYWRQKAGGLADFRLVDSVAERSQTIAVSRVSAKVAIIFSDQGSLVYYESEDSGVSWGLGAGFGEQHDLPFPGIWHDLAAAYDYSDVLHVVFVQSIQHSGASALWHWSAPTGFRQIVDARCTFPGIPAPLSTLNHPQLSVGTGPRLNDLFLVWEQVGESYTASDVAANGLINSHLYITSSLDGGATWNVGERLFSTTTPGCSGDCFSEVYPSVPSTPDSVVRLLFLIDREPGSTPYNSWTMTTDNPVYYATVTPPGVSTSAFAGGIPCSIGPQVVGAGRLDTVSLFLDALGTADLMVTMTDTMSWLEFESNPDMHETTIQVGDPRQELMIILNATSLNEAQYSGTIQVSSNASNVDGMEIQVLLTVTAQDTLLPDIVTRPNDLLDNAIEYDSGCNCPVLRLSYGAANVGWGPLYLHGVPPVPPDTSYFVMQKVFLTDGSSYDRPAGVFYHDEDHGHIHIVGWADYRLRAVLPGDGVGELVVSSKKANFCVADGTIHDASLPAFNPYGQFFECATDSQGLTVGWADIYTRNVPGQTIEIAGVPDGEYWLEAEADPDDQILELDENNNVARVKVTITGVCNCPLSCDFDNNAVLDPLDMNALIDVLFFSGVNPQSPNCMITRADFNADGAPDPLDLNELIDHLFFGGPQPVDPCAP